MRKFLCTICTASFVLLVLYPIAIAQKDLGSRQLVLDFLMVGDVDGWVNHLGDAEPAIDITLVPCRAFSAGLPDNYLYRISRIYFPRTREHMTEYDVLFFNHPRLSFFTILQQEMMVDFIATKDKASIAYPLSHYLDVQVPWLNSPICRAFPVDAEKFYSAMEKNIPDEFDGLTRLRLEPGRPPVFSVFERTGMFDARIYESSRPAYAKEGATIWVYMIDGPKSMPEAPAFLSWRYGDSLSWAFGLHPGARAKHWAEMGDWWELAFLNICYYTMGRGILEFDELLNMRMVKSQFSFYRDSSSMFQSIVDFVSKVGANTAEGEMMLLEGDEIRAEAETDYLQGEYEGAKTKMEEALEIATQAMDEAIKAKDRALTWIYLSEWFATAAVLLVSGVLLWGLMIRRKLYREVITTQTRHL